MRFPIRPPVVVVTPPPDAAAPVKELVTEEVVTTRFSVRWMLWRGLFWLLLAFGIQALASMMPDAIEYFYSPRFYHYMVRSLALIFNLVRFSVGEVLYAALVFWFVIWTFWYMRRALRGEARYFDVYKLFFLHIVWALAALSVFFQILWGLNYQRMPIAETLGLERPPPRTDELQSVGARILNGINRNYATASVDQNWGGPSRLPSGPLQLFQAVEAAYQNTALIGNASQGGVGVPKPLYLSRLMSWIGVSGMYIPYTGEVTFNIELPDNQLPFVIAHEKAHQRGYAREDEANFIAYVVCINAPDPYVRYSGYLQAVKVLYALERADVGRYRDQIGPGPSADLDARALFWNNVQNPTFSQLVSRMRAAYLRANRVRSGLKNYDEDIILIINYHLKNGSVE